MLIQPWDATTGTDEWRTWLAESDRFAVLAVNHLDPAQAPLLVPTHITLAGDEVLCHLARTNPIWPHLEAAVEVRLAVTGDHAYVPGYWRVAPDAREQDCVPTSYYASVQLVCRPTVVDDTAGKAQLLAAQLADLQPEGRHAEMAIDDGPYARMLPGIRGLRLAVVRAEAKFKYDDHKPPEHRERVAAHLERRGQGSDAGAAAQQRRRLAALGDWRQRRSRA